MNSTAPVPLLDQLRNLALPLFVALVYLNISAVFVRQYDIPSLLRIVVVVLAVLAITDLKATANALLQPLTFLTAAYLSVLLLTSTFARNTRLADERLAEVAKAFGIALLMMALGTTWSRLRNSAYVLIGCATFLSLLAIFQTITGTYGRWYGGFARVKNAHIYGDVFQPRISGPLGDPNFFAQILLMVVPVALFVGWEAERRRVRLLAFAAAAAIVSALFLTYSRGGMLALGVVLTLALIAHRVDRKRLVAGAAALLIVLVALPASFTRRFVTIEQILPGGEEELHPDASFEKRKLLTAAAWETFKDNPLLGVGAGNYTVWFDHYAEQVGSAAREYDDPGERHYPHSLYLEIAAETGFVGLLTFGTIVLVSFANLRSAHRVLTGIGERQLGGIAKALELALIGYLVSSLFLHGHFLRYLWMLFAMGSAFFTVATRQLITHHSSLITEKS